MLVAAIAERASGVSFQRLLQGNLFDRAGLGSTSFDGAPQWGGPPPAGPYGTDDQESPAARLVDWRRVGWGGVRSTVEDLFRYFRALQSGRIGSQGQLEQLFAAHVRDGRRAFYGYGWRLSESALGSRISSSGAGPRGGGALAYCPGRDLLIVVMGDQIERRSFLGLVPLEPRSPALGLWQHLEAGIASGEFGRPRGSSSPGRRPLAVLVTVGLAAALGFLLRRRVRRRT